MLVGERPGLRAGGVWSETCVFCHNTVPYFDALWGELAGPGAPGYQGAVVDRLLPRERRWRCDVDRRRRGGAARRRGRRGGRGRGHAAARRRRSARRARARHPRAAVALRRAQLRRDRHRLRGVPRRQPRARRRIRAFIPTSRRAARSCRRARRRAARSRAPSRSIASARAATRCCSRATRSRGRGRRGGGGKPGGSSITSGEARDFLLGGCARQMSCATCHDPHAEDRRADLDRLATSPATRSASAAIRNTRRRRRWPRTPTTIRPAPARAASPATCRRRTWGSATR